MLKVSPFEVNVNRVDISILIVNWNARDLLRECLRSVYDQSCHATCEVIVVDNASTDRTCECISEEFSQVRIIQSTQNLGFARGNNLGASHANGDYLLLLNPDTVVREDSIQSLWDCAQTHPEAGAVGGVCELPDGSIDPGCRQFEPDMTQRCLDLFGCAATKAAHLDRSIAFEGSVPILSGAYMMVRMGVWREMGGLDETFTLYAEETDFCYRIRKAGYDVCMTGKSRILHKVGSGNPNDPLRKLNCTRGLMHFYRKHFTAFQSTCVAIMIWLHSLERVLGSLVLMPWFGTSRSRCLRKRMSLVLRHPRSWWHGWQGQQL